MIFLSILSSSIISLLVTPYIIKLGRKKKIFDLPSPRKTHKKEIVHIGGTSILIGYLSSVAIFLLTFKDQLSAEHLITYLVLLLGSLCFYLVGLIDDLIDVSPFIRLGTQIIISSIIFLSGVSLFPINIPFFGGLDSSILILINFTLTIFWIVGITNAINWFDGLDGLATGVCILTLLSFSVIFINSGNIIYCLFSIALAGSCLGFLKYNFFPAKIIMGDSGSNLLGFNLAIFSILELENYDNLNFFLSNNRIIISLLLLSIPLLDMIYVILKRIKNNRSPFYPDKFHLHHRLMNIGFAHKETVFLIYFIHQFPIFIALYFSKIINVVALTLSMIFFLFVSLKIIRKFLVEFKGKKLNFKVK